MTEVRPGTAADAVQLVELLRQLGYDNDPHEVGERVGALLTSCEHQVLVAAEPSAAPSAEPSAEPRVDGVIVVERRQLLERPAHAQVTALVVRRGRRRSGVGRALMDAAEHWAATHGLSAVVVQSNVDRSESHLLYQGLGYRRTATSHIYRKALRP